ncbi:MAG TPA: TIGR04279 domain-containing protein, partial [Methanosarcina sp.]
YNIRIDGKSNASSVKLKITATQKVEVDSTGSLTYKYDTKSIPAGNFELKIGSSTKQVELKPAEDLPSEITSSTEQNSSEEKRSDENSWNNLKFILSYPYSLRSFYTINESVKIIYKGPETLGQRSVDIYLVKECNTSYPENVNLSSMNESKISLEDVINNNTESYIQIPATLNEGGDLSPMTLGPLPAGNYWVLINLAGNKTETSESENKTLLAKSFEVLEYEMEAEAPYTVGEGKNFDINMSLKNALAQKNYTYWSVLIRKDAYTTEEGTNSSWMTAGTRPIVNGVDIIKILETNLTKYESEDGKEKLKEKIQTTIGKENGIVSIGEENQSNLSMKSLGLASGDYVLIAGANENDKGLVGIAQNKLKISAEKSYGLNLGSSLGNVTLGNVSSMKLKDSLFTGIESILNSKNIHF